VVAKRLTRREIVQEDKIQATLSKIYEWSSQNRSFLITFFAIFLLSLLGSYFWQNYQLDRSEEIQVQFGEALKIYHAPVVEDTAEDSEEPIIFDEYIFETDEERLEKALESFTAVGEDYPGTHLGLLARYYIGLIKQEMGQMGIAESQDDPQRATQLLEAILQENSASFPTDALLLRLAQNYEAAGNAEKAMELYRKLTTEYPTSDYSQEARLRLDQLEEEQG
jgi:predicted negative regulator of RcsB-dependent stress response